jgi:hypothetical protein
MQFEANRELCAGSIPRKEGNVFTAEFHLHTALAPSLTDYALERQDFMFGKHMVR